MTEPAPHGHRKVVQHAVSLLWLLFASLWFCFPLVYGSGDSTGGSRGFHGLLFDSHEKLHYVIRLSEMHNAVELGQWMPRWCSNLAGGYGYPFFNFYAPLSYYLACLWHLLGANLFTAWKIHFLLMTWLAGVGTFYFALLYYGRLAAVVAALLYVFAPYHLSNLYVRGNVAEFTAMTVLPFLMLSVQCILRWPRSSKAWWACALAMAAMVLTHNITALLSAGLLAVWLLIMLRKHPHGTASAVFALFAGILFSCFFWLPAIVEMKYTKAAGLQATFGATYQHVVYWKQYFSNSWGFGLSEPGPGDQMSFSLGLAQWAGIIGCLAVVVKDRFRDHRSCAWPFFTLLLLALMSTWCTWFWRMPGAGAVQFPWRVLVFAALFAAMSGGCFVHNVASRAPVLKWPLGGALILILCWSSVGKIGVVGYFPNRPEMYGSAATRQRFITTNIGEFLPIWSDLNEEEIPSRRRIVSDAGKTIRNIAAPEALKPSFRFIARGGEKIRFEMFYFPGWEVRGNGELLPVGPSPEGMIEFEAPPGDTAYQLKFGHSPVRLAATFVSVAALVGALGGTLLILRRRRPGFSGSAPTSAP